MGSWDADIWRCSRASCRRRDRSRNARPTRRLRVTWVSQLTMSRRRHSVAACPRKREIARRRSMNSSPSGNGAGNPDVSGSRCAKSSANVGPCPVRRRVWAIKMAAARAHSSAVSSPVKSSKTYAHAAGGGAAIPRHQIGLGSGSTSHRRNRGRTHGPTPRGDQLSSGWAAHVQGTAEYVRRTWIVSYGLRNYAIRIRPYDRATFTTLMRCPGGTNRSKRSGARIPSASRHRFDPPVSVPASARRMSPIGQA